MPKLKDLRTQLKPLTHKLQLLIKYHLNSKTATVSH